MAELVDAAGLGPVGLRLLEVRVLSPASSRTLAPVPAFKTNGRQATEGTASVVATNIAYPLADVILLSLVEKLAAATAGNGRSYRLGGDEFCLLAPADAQSASRLLDVSLEALCEHGEGFSVTSSFGAVLLPEQAREGTEALREADERLYVQKRGKRSARDQPHEVLLQALYEREPDIHTHANEVTEFAVAVGRRLGLDDTAMDGLHRAAMLHDIGKIAIPDQILHSIPRSPAFLSLSCTKDSPSARRTDGGTAAAALERRNRRTSADPQSPLSYLNEMFRRTR